MSICAHPPARSLHSLTLSPNTKRAKFKCPSVAAQKVEQLGGARNNVEEWPPVQNLQALSATPSSFTAAISSPISLATAARSGAELAAIANNEAVPKPNAQPTMHHSTHAARRCACTDSAESSGRVVTARQELPYQKFRPARWEGYQRNSSVAA